jgi:hypothetical protein
VRQANLKTLRQEFVNPYVRMVPLQREQLQVYRFAEKMPPGLEGYQPRWEIVNAVLGAQQTLQVRVDLASDFHVLAMLGSATTNTVGGFRVQVYDQLKRLRMADRGVQFPNIGGKTSATFFLREPYRFDLPRSQMLVMLQNMETVQNTVQIVFYGVAAPFTGSLSNE